MEIDETILSVISSSVNWRIDLNKDGTCNTLGPKIDLSFCLLRSNGSIADSVNKADLFFSRELLEFNFAENMALTWDDEFPETRVYCIIESYSQEACLWLTLEGEDLRDITECVKKLKRGAYVRDLLERRY